MPCLALFGCCALFGCLEVSFGCHLGAVGQSLGVIGIGGCGWWLWPGVLASSRCCNLVTVGTHVSNKVNKCTIEFIGSVAELLSLLFCASGDPEVKGSIPYVYIISF